jgi:hypothetical protein
VNALELIALKQRVPADYVEEIEMFVLVRFDAAKRGRLDGVGYNFISRHLVQAQYIFARLKAPKELDIARAAGVAWIKAGARPTDELDLTTAEYTAMRAGLRAYFRALPKIEIATYRQACNVAEQAMA